MLHCRTLVSRRLWFHSAVVLLQLCNLQCLLPSLVYQSVNSVELAIVV